MIPRMTKERLSIAFLQNNRQADEIVMDSESGLPVKAIYRYDKITGVLRKYPVEYYFWEDGEDED